jgi:hypothetical protein
MIFKRHLAPSPGFVLIVASYTLLGAFLAWGFSEPRLDQAQRVLDRMQRPGFAGLDSDEIAALRSTLDDHPDFARVLIGRSKLGHVEPTQSGWTSLPTSHVLIRPSAAGPLRLTTACRGALDAYPVSVVFHAPGLDKSLSFERPGEQTFDLPSGYPSKLLWVTVTLAQAKRPAAGSPPVQIDVDGDVVTQNSDPSATPPEGPTPPTPPSSQANPP